MEATVFNPIQQHLLMMFAYDSTEERLKEIKEVLMNYFAKKVEDKFNYLWDSGVLNQEKLDEIRGMHLHTDLPKWVELF